jgi:exonuclease III
MEDHLDYPDSDHTYTEYYSLGAEYCRQALKQVGVCIFVHKKLTFSNVNLNEFCKQQDLEVCAVKLQFPFGNICILSIYRAPSGNFSYFLNGLDAILKSLYNTNLEFIICGDINVNYLVHNNRKNN